MAKTIKVAQPKLAARVKNAFSKKGSNPTNPAKPQLRANVVRAAKGGSGLTQNSVAANLTKNSARSSVKKNLSPVVGTTKTAKPFGKNVVPSQQKAGKGGGFKSFIGGK